MIEQTSIELSETFLHTIRNVQEPGNELLIAELMNHNTVVENMLGGYYYEGRGKVYGINLQKDSIVFENNLTGYLTLNYHINYTIGCQDVRYNDMNKMRITFEIDLSEKIIKLTGETIRERDPDMY